MYLHTQLLINEILPDEPDPAAANALQEGLGGQFGEMRTMMQYLFQSINFRGDANSKPYKDLLQGVGTEEISHVELIGTTIAQLLDGSPAYQGKKTDPVDEPGAKGATPLKIALDTSNIHHYLVGAQGALPVDAAGNPWSGSYVYNSGNLVLDLLYNLMLEATGRLQKCRIYEMTDNKTARSTISYLIVATKRTRTHSPKHSRRLGSTGEPRCRSRRQMPSSTLRSRSFWTRVCIAFSTASVPTTKVKPTSCSGEPHPPMTAPS